MKPKPSRPVIGWREWVALPLLGVEAIKLKVDTGARSSALHAFDMQIFRDRDGVEKVRFSVHPKQGDNRCVVWAVAPLADHRWIKSSSGRQTLRPVIITDLRVGDETWPIELTLINRDEMGFRMLLGRQAIRRRFVVDPARSFVVGKAPDGEQRARRRKKKKSKSVAPKE